jgi:hypothetical protein
LRSTIGRSEFRHIIPQYYRLTGDAARGASQTVGKAFIAVRGGWTQAYKVTQKGVAPTRRYAMFVPILSLASLNTREAFSELLFTEMIVQNQ